MLSAFVVSRRWAVTTSQLIGLVVVVFVLLEARRIIGSDRPFGGPELAHELRRLAQIIGVSCAILGPVAALETGLGLRRNGAIWMLAQSPRGLNSIVVCAVVCGAATSAAIWIGSQVGPQSTDSLHFTKVDGQWVWRPWSHADALAFPRASFELPRVETREFAAAAGDRGTRIGNAHWVAGAAVMVALLRGVASSQRSTWQAHAGFVNAIAAMVALWVWMPALALAVVVSLSLTQVISIRVLGVRAA